MKMIACLMALLTLFGCSDTQNAEDESDDTDLDEIEFVPRDIIIDRAGTAHSRPYCSVLLKNDTLKLNGVHYCRIENLYPEDVEYVCPRCVSRRVYSHWRDYAQYNQRWRSLYDNLDTKYSNMPSYGEFHRNVTSSPDGYKHRLIVFERAREYFDVGDNYEEFKERIGLRDTVGDTFRCT